MLQLPSSTRFRRKATDHLSCYNCPNPGSPTVLQNVKSSDRPVRVHKHPNGIPISNVGEALNNLAAFSRMSSAGQSQHRSIAASLKLRTTTSLRHLAVDL